MTAARERSMPKASSTIALQQSFWALQKHRDSNLKFANTLTTSAQLRVLTIQATFPALELLN